MPEQKFHIPHTFQSRGAGVTIDEVDGASQGIKVP